MMSALAIILTAGMVVPGDGPEKVSGEVVQRLDLRGNWEGKLRSNRGEVYRVRIDRKVILIEFEENTMGFSTSNIIDQGGGKLLYHGRLGLYRQADDLLIICIGDVHRRPQSIGAEQGNFIKLHRVKSRK